jgi:hypothetical protein
MSDERRVDFRDLNWMGKTVYLGGSALRLTARLIDSAVDRAGAIAEESRRAYKRELDPNVEDAKVLSEDVRRPDESRTAGGS